MEYRFEKVQITKKHIDILFNLLSNRKFSISHKEMPSYSEHEKFVNSHPYKHWLLISHKNIYIGSFYIQYDNSIGINLDPLSYDNALPLIIKKIKISFKPSPAVKSKISKKFFINVPVEDKSFNKKVQELGYLPSQISYEIN